MRKSVICSWLLIIFLGFWLIGCGGGTETSKQALSSETTETVADYSSEESLISGAEEPITSDEPLTSEDSEPDISQLEVIFFSPQRLVVSPNSLFSLMVEIGSVEDVFGVGFDLKYDPNFFEYVSVSEGDFLSKDCRTFLATASYLGELNAGFTRLGKDCGTVSGPGLVAIFIFQTLNQTGESEISFFKNYICILEEDGSHSFKDIEQRAALIKVQ